MREMSVFDVIGPVMVGPSSSHTAGALRIARTVRKLARYKIVAAHFKLYGSFSQTYRGHGTDKALVAGILGFATDDLRIRDSFAIAKESGVEVSFEICDEENDFHPNTVEVTATGDNGVQLFVRGSSIGGGEIEITNINGFSLSFSGRYNAVIVTQKDEPGVVANIASVFERFGINIAYMSVYREGKGDNACSIIEIDGMPDDKFIQELANQPSISSVRYFRLAG